jgi:nucleotide-binding universal stress UspA family protein
MISRMLVGTDGSDTARKACKYAVEMAKPLGAKIILLNVIDQNIFGKPLIPASETPVHLMESVEDYLRQAARIILSDLEEMCKEEGIPVKSVIRNGHAVEEIITEARASKADLIVVGSHGRSAVEAAVLGSVTFGVIHKDTKIPVLVVRR